MATENSEVSRLQHATGTGIPAAIMGLAFTDEGERRLAGAPHGGGGVQGSQQLPVTRRRV